MTIPMKFKSEQNLSLVLDTHIVATCGDLLTGWEHGDFGKGRLEILIHVAQDLPSISHGKVMGFIILIVCVA